MLSNKDMMIKLTTGLLALFSPALLWAQDLSQATGEAEVRRFAVEVIIFRYAENVGIGSEVFLPDEPEASGIGGTLDVLGKGDPESERVGQSKAATRPDIELELLDRASLELVETYERLKRLDAYEPLMHFGWTQAAWPQQQTEAIPLHRFARPPAALDGSLTLYLGRYLHLVVDLELRAPDEVAAAAAPASGFNRFAASIGGGERAPARPVLFRIREDRILRSGELRYYDHPKFGLLARVSRIETEEESGQGELLGYPVQ